MNKVFRGITVLSLLGLAASARPAAGQAAMVGRSPLAQAAALMGHRSPAQVTRWLRAQQGVETVGLGRDDRTLVVRWRSGGESLILPATANTRMVATARRHMRVIPMMRDAAPGGRALVLEPFATELGLGPQAGAPEVSALRKAGFSVDQAYDTQVTVNSMANLTQYNVIYMHTHSGVDTSGHGVLATGEQTSCGSYTNADGSVVTVGVAGSTQCYYAITSQFISGHLGRFPANAILFLNGCALLNSSEFIGALSAQGAGVTLSWDADATAADDFLSAAAFFNEMATGTTVAGALKALQAAGYGKSTYQGQQANLGYRGNGAITLASAGGSAPPPPSNTPTATTAPTSTPQPTATGAPPPPPTPAPTVQPTTAPTAVATATTPAPPATLSLIPTVKPGNSQVIEARAVSPHTKVQFHVVFPDGQVLDGSASADGNGVARFSYLQPAGSITRSNSTAVVQITGANEGTAFHLRGRYTVAFGRIDLAVAPHSVARGQRVGIWVHSAAHVHVVVTVLWGHGRRGHLHARTGTHGWVALRATVPRALKSGTQVSILVSGRVHGRTARSTASFRVQ